MTRRARQASAGAAVVHAAAHTASLRQPVTLRLFVAGATPQATAAIEMAARLRRDHLEPHDTLEVIDVALQPGEAARHGVIALPALVRTDVTPQLSWVGSLSPFAAVLRAVGLVPRSNARWSHAVPAVPPPADEADAWLVAGPRGPELNLRPGADAALRELTQSAAPGLGLMSPAGVILYANASIAGQLGVAPERLLASELWEHLHESDAQAVRRQLAQQGGSANATVRSRHAAGRQGALHLSLSPLHGHADTHVAIVLQELDTWRSVLARLESQHERLEALVAERTRQLRQMLSQAETAQRAKSAFLSKMSHEIRTPLNAILGFAHLLLREVQEPAQRERLRKMELAGKHLLVLLTEVLELARIEADHVHLNLAPLDLPAILQRVQAMVAEAASGKGLPVRVAPAPALPAGAMGDGPRIAQCLLNLVSNAVKFSEDGEIVVQARVIAGDDARLVLQFDVIDDGPGVAAAEAARLFSPFEQGAATSTLQPGSGLGLAITRGLARAMGGDCGVEPRPEGGSRFWFTTRLVLAADNAAEPHAERAAARADDSEGGPARQALAARHAGRRVLVVEDDPVNQEVTGQLLRSAGLEVLMATNGQEALQMLAAQPAVGLVLMDLCMPGLGGLDTARRMRLAAGPATPPIVALTGNAFAEDRQACLQAGMAGFLAKPVDVGLLYETVLYWLDQPPRDALAP